MIAALFVDESGCYPDVPFVYTWGVSLDARLYNGPWPVIAHPPCQRWGNFWFGSPSNDERHVLGDDGGCFAHALWAVRRFGGVLEHPAGSRAWDYFDIPAPPSSGGWVADGMRGRGWSCHVDQGHYGHRARKPTWLYAVRCDLPSLKWGPSEATCEVELMGKRERAATPLPFRDILLAMARSVDGGSRTTAIQLGETCGADSGSGREAEEENCE